MSDKAYIFGSGPFGIALRTLPGKMVSHWLFQGLAYMDPTERAFKLGLDGLLALAIAAALLSMRWPAGLVAVVAILGAHSLNFLFNGQLRVVLKWHGIGRVPKAAIEVELVRIAARLTANPAIRDGYVFGSLSRGELHDGSDLDIRVIRAPGLRAGLTACFAVLTERSRSLRSGVPLDIYVWDSPASLARMRADEKPISLSEILADSQRRIDLPGSDAGTVAVGSNLTT
jgi:predicted nucleotidyltransferase